MESAIRDDVMIYVCTRRAYAYYIHREYKSLQTVRYCPFCGTRLPDDLIEEYDVAVYEILGQAGVELIAGNERFLIPPKELPQEFQTDEWWKKRGL
jgi:hypothetical protein